MSAENPYLCGNCPGKGDGAVDFDVNGSCAIYTADSFKQSRRYKLLCSEDYSSDEELATLSARSLRYFDDEVGDFDETTGDLRASQLGVACARVFLKGECDKSLIEIIRESDLD